MSFRINTNVAAMGALRNLNGTSSDLNRSINRLSTGLRIVNGSDDPAGLIASENFRAQLGGMDPRPVGWDGRRSAQQPRRIELCQDRRRGAG